MKKIKDEGPILGVCIVPDCRRASYCRGICHSHYNSATKLIERKQTTWDKLEKSGKVEPTHNRKGYGKNQAYFLGD